MKRTDIDGWATAVLATGMFLGSLVGTVVRAEEDASLSEIYDWAGRALFAQEQYPQAAEEFLYAAGRDSTNYQVLHRAGEALHMAADFTGAEKMYLRAIQIKPDAAKTYCTLGVAYLKMKRGREAEEAWRAAIRVDPRFQEGIAYYNLASEMKHQGRTAAVDSICRELAEVEPVWEQRLRETLAKPHH
jgi:tetratricopeptide (TPR) repeat protein